MRTITELLRLAGITGEATGPATTALQALLSDAQSEISTASASADAARREVQSEIQGNQQARALAGSFRKVAEKAGVDLSALSDSGISAERRRELSDSASQAVLDFVGGSAGEASDAAGILNAAGFDLGAYQKAGKEKRAELAKAFTDSVTGDKARLRGLERDAALSDLKLDPRKAGRILGDVTLEKGKATVKGADGEPLEVETWGIKQPDGTFTPAEKLIVDAGWTMQELAPREQAAEAADTTAQPGGWSLNDGQGQSGVAQTGGLLDFLSAKPDAKPAS